MSLSLLDVAVMYQKKREERLAIQKQVDKLAEEESNLKLAFFRGLDEAGINAVGSPKFNYARVTKMEPNADNWEELYSHIQETGHFELLFRRINPAAVKERWENGLSVPGVKAFPVEKFSITKAKE